MKGVQRMQTKGVQYKTPLMVQDLGFVQGQLKNSALLDDLLFEAQLNTGLSALLCLGEMVANNKLGLGIGGNTHLNGSQAPMHSGYLDIRGTSCLRGIEFYAEESWAHQIPC